MTTNEWQIQEIQAAIAEADAGDFASELDVRAVTGKWDGHADSVAQSNVGHSC